MRSLSYYRYWKFHFDCFKASNFRSEKPMGGGSIWPPLGRSRINMICHNSDLYLWFILIYNLTLKWREKRKSLSTSRRKTEKKGKKRKSSIRVRRESNPGKQIQSPTFYPFCCGEALNITGSNWSCQLNVIRKIQIKTKRAEPKPQICAFRPE